MKRLNAGLNNDYVALLPVFPFPNAESAIAAEMDRTIKKAFKTIAFHSITAKPNYKKGIKSSRQKEFYNKREFNNWIDDAYLLIGKASMMKTDYYAANGALRQITKDYPKEKTVYEAQIWLCRKLIIEGEFMEAGEILEKLGKDKKFPRRQVSFYNAVYADFYISQKQFEKAIPHLEIAAKKANGKQLRLRYNYLLGQLYQNTGQMDEASKKFTKVIGMSPPYEMAFSARINLANSFQSGASNSNTIRQNLYKLLRDEKNKDYKDQIYYALANIDIKEGNVPVAIDNYKLSAKSSVSNPRQKARSFLAIADIKYNDRDYLAAQEYYDSAMINIDETYPDYIKINTKSKGLSRLANNLNIVSLQDSVQFIAKMTENERNMFIDQIIAKVKEKEAEEKRRLQEEMLEQQNNYSQATELENSRNSSSSMDGNKWYFYSPSSKSYGVNEFQMKWGKRKLDDNWRRSSRKLAGFGNESEESADEEGGDDNKEKKKGLDNKSRDFYVIDLPLTDSAMIVSHEKIRKGLFNSGSIYKDELNEYKLAAKQYEEIVKRYPEHELAADAAYQLYILYRQLENATKMEEYKNFLITKFPESIYTKLLTNPNIASELEQKEKEIEKYYEDCYNSYNASNYDQSLRSAQVALNAFPNHKLQAKFLLLMSMTKGKIFGPDSLRSNLNFIIKNFPKSEETVAAKDIIAMIDEVRPEIKEKQEVEIAREIYKTILPDEKHYLVAVIQPKQGNFNQLIFNLINFNLDNFIAANLSTKAEAISNNNQIVVVSEFKSKDESLNYFDAVMANPSNTKDVGIISAVFVISETNLAVFKQDGSESRYMKYFKENYQR